MAKFQARPTVGVVTETFRMGSKANPLRDEDKGKAVTLAAESQVDLAASDQEIMGFASSIESGTQDGFKIGGVQIDNYAVVDTGDAEIGDLVVVDSNPALGTPGKTKVKKGTPVKYLWEVVHPGVIRKI